MGLELLIKEGGSRRGEKRILRLLGRDEIVGVEMETSISISLVSRTGLVRINYGLRRDTPNDIAPVKQRINSFPPIHIMALVIMCILFHIPENSCVELKFGAQTTHLHQSQINNLSPYSCHFRNPKHSGNRCY